MKLMRDAVNGPMKIEQAATMHSKWSMVRSERKTVYEIFMEIFMALGERFVQRLDAALFTICKVQSTNPNSEKDCILKAKSHYCSICSS